MAHPEQPGDRVAGRLHLAAAGDAHADRPDGIAADEVLANRPDRNEDLVVGIGESRSALWLQDADHLERDAADGDRRTNGVGAEPEVGRDSCAEDDDAQ